MLVNKKILLLMHKNLRWKFLIYYLKNNQNDDKSNYMILENKNNELKFVPIHLIDLNKEINT